MRKIALVTGAASGIGRASATALAKAGFALALVDRDEAAGRKAESELSKSGTDCAFFACDVVDDDQVRGAVDAAVALFGRLDVAVNAAGLDSKPGALIDDSLVENWHNVIGVNLTGVWHCMRHEVRAMLASGGGSIINLSSIAGMIGVPFLAGYVASKHAVIGLTKSAALEYVREGIRVNAVCPGVIDTPMQRRGIDAEPQGHAQMVANSPSGRMGSADEVAAAIAWLASDSASFVTGQALAIDGGWTAGH